MAAKKKEKESPVRIMSDEEFYAMKLKEDKESIIDSLVEAANQKTTKFSVLRKKKEPEPIQLNNDSEDSDKIIKLSELQFNDTDTDPLTDIDWSSLMEKFDEISPIDDITYEDRMNYRRKTSDDKYDELFKKEQSMLNDLLSQLQKRSKTVDKKIELMSGSKSTYGVSKNLTELLDVSNSIEVNKLNVIKELVNIKKTATDLRMKEQKLAPEDANMEEDRDTIADRFYKSIVAGKSKDFIQSSMSGYSEQVGIQNYNITQPMRNYPEDELNENRSNDTEVDAYGYIRNEVRNVQVCLCQNEDGTNEFIALDEDNNAVYDYELPSPNLLVDISIKPGAAFAYDKFSRKYPIVEETSINFGPPPEEDPVQYETLDDLDEYKDASNDDKYDYAREDDEDDDYEDLVEEE